MNEIIWQEMRLEDVAQVVELERQSFSVPWTAQDFRDEVSNDLAYYLLGWLDGQVIAYAGMWLVVDEAQITNVAVAGGLRGQGIGYQLMRRLIHAAAARSAKAMTLEVRPSNTAALALYNKFGFEHVGRRKDYYKDRDTHEDALILWLHEERFTCQANLAAGQ